MAIKCLITKSQVEAHDKGARFIANALRQGGMEVVYTRFVSPDEIVQTALQEDVDTIGISMLCGGYSYVASRVMELLREKKLDIPVIFGGQIPDDEKEKVIAAGVEKVFPQGTTAAEVVDFIKSIVGDKSQIR